jgi:hypothetical protein
VRRRTVGVTFNVTVDRQEMVIFLGGQKGKRGKRRQKVTVYGSSSAH